MPENLRSDPRLIDTILSSTHITVRQGDQLLETTAIVVYGLWEKVVLCQSWLTKQEAVVDSCPMGIPGEE
ncbi:hypothetical protein PR048_020479 [Dryococelus australis]|uniref:Uncharacterized protein n=1 Tax=Dryococelus australis TaxID=614101 RepID=A0ABQ9H6G9_9NEOP|nr:hypothetical protein PR048_020479 [Dryococelus australis]